MSDYQSFEKWIKRVHDVKLPHWDELPKFDLYMDQMIALVNGYLTPLGLEPVTPSMVNNYVKHNIIVAPVKKKYQVMQIADILLVMLLKQNFSIEDIRIGIDRITATDFPKQAFDKYIDLINAKLQQIGTEHMIAFTDNLTDRLMEVTANGIVNQLESNQLAKIIESSKEHEPTKLK